MTRKELNEPYRMQREIERDRERLKEMESRAASCGAALTGMPAGGGVSDKVASGAIDIAMLKDQIAAKISERDVVIARLWTQIDGLDDSVTREILKMRHLDCLTFRQIAARLGGNNTEEGVKMRYYRIMRKIGAVW